MVSTKKLVKKLAKRQDELEREIRAIKPKRIRRLVRRLDRSARDSRVAALVKRRTAS